MKGCDTYEMNGLKNKKGGEEDNYIEIIEGEDVRG